MNASPQNLHGLSRAYTYLGATQSLCPECMKVVPAKIIARAERVYFRKRCPTHGLREDFICSDRSWYDRYDYALPAKLPKETFVAANKGCPYDCGLCADHEQHTCIGVLEITDNCNLTCPVCYAASAPGKAHRSLDEVRAAIDALVKAEGRPDVLQLSGGEPTTHPQLHTILDYALAQPIQYVMLNTNGLLLAKEDALLTKLAQHRDRIEIYLQFDGTTDLVQQRLRGESLTQIKLRALDRLGEYGLNVTLVATLQPGVNEDQLGALLEIASARPYVTGLSLQPTTYSGRSELPEVLEKRITFPDVIRGLCEQSQGSFQPSDFFPLPCAHPNCHILSLAYRYQGKLVPLTRFLDAKANLDLLANGLSFSREQGVRLAAQYVARNHGCGTGCGPAGCGASSDEIPEEGKQTLADVFWKQVMEKEIGAKQLFRITITSFLDVYNFDIRRVMKCCTHHVLPSGHIIPFCAYNVLYRPGHVPLPELLPK